MADEPSELERLVALVAQRIREQLEEEGGLQRLIEGRRQLEAQLEASGRLEAGETTTSAEASPFDTIPAGRASGTYGWAGSATGFAPAVLVLQTAAPNLAKDIEGRSPRDITLVVNLYMAFVTTLSVLLPLWQQPPNLTQIIDVFNNQTNVVYQTINMPPPSP